MKLAFSLSLMLLGVSSTESLSPTAAAWGIRPVYIRAMGAFLPNEPVSNDDIEKHLGLVQGKFSKKIRKQILSTNGIERRYYAMQNGQPTHLGLDMGVEAVKDALANAGGVALDTVGMLAAGSTCPDVFVPGIANLLHGKLPTSKSLDCQSLQGVCASGMNGLKTAFHSLTLGEHDRALVVGTETSSHVMHSQRFNTLHNMEDFNPRDSFSSEFLRYMLSDGSSCALLDHEPHPNQLSYRIEGFYHHSFAHELKPCMVGGVSRPGKSIELEDIWKSKENPHEQLFLQQDVKSLNENIIKKCGEALDAAREHELFDMGEIDWILPHVSSHYFLKDAKEMLEEKTGVSQDQMWTNLPWVGNVGAASPFLLLWGALHKESKTSAGGNNETTPDIQVGDKVLIVTPESGQFSFQFLLVTVVDESG